MTMDSIVTRKNRSHVIHVVTRQDHKNTSRYGSHYIPCPLFRGGRYNCFDMVALIFTYAQHITLLQI